MIHFVGAGPGDRGLITLKGKELLERADLVIYAGSLVPKELLSFCSKEARIFDSSKMTLEEVLIIMKEADDKGSRVVRLHTGDPSIYGAIREQMDGLISDGYDFEVVPGVSSFVAAAAALKKEYTLPAVSQSIIITRMEGRTGVPEREKLKELAKHGSSMAVFLSAGMTGQVQKALLEAGTYNKDTPAALVYKVTHEDEKLVRCTVGSLNDEAEREGISRTALILVGDFLSDDRNTYEKSRLYDADFSTGYRRGGEKRLIRAISFTDRGKETGERLKRSFGDDLVFEAFDKGMSLDKWTEACFREDCDMIFIGAAGIAVRSIAPHIKSKATDPAVVVTDDRGENVIPILSGHIGGGNALAGKIADILGARAVITTSSDINGVFSIDEWAARRGMVIDDISGIKAVSSKLLKNEKVYFKSYVNINGDPPVGLIPACDGMEDKDIAVVIGINKVKNDTVLHIIPRICVIGTGCRKGTDSEKYLAAFERFCEENDISEKSVALISSIDIKAEEACIKSLCGKLKAGLETYSAGELNEVKLSEGEFAASAFVEDVTGTDNVCERSAVRAAGADRLLVKKSGYDGITFAAALVPCEFNWRQIYG